MTTPKLAAIGECMIELSSPEGPFHNPAMNMNVSMGGDTLNTAIYLSRLGTRVSYATSIGTDAYSNWMLSRWLENKIDSQLVSQIDGRLPGLYMIETDQDGERHFHYWRKNSPARELFDDQDRSQVLFEKLATFEYLYLSGITLSLYKNESQQRLLSFLTEYSSAGGKVLFDSNYRPALWPDPEHCRTIYQQVYELTHIALPTKDDECLLFGDSSTEQILQRITSYGVDEVVLKLGSEGCVCWHDGKATTVSCDPVKNIVDTTAAGDAFNAGYIHHRIEKNNVEQAAMNAHSLAKKVIQHKGAIIPHQSS